MSFQRFTPKQGTRGTQEYVYFELSMAQGPVAIGVTGQNRLIDFIGRAWLLLLAEDMTLHLFRQLATVGQWEEVTANLPPVFSAPLPEGSRRVSFAFDQAARVNVAYERNGFVYLTRWDATASQYVQNVAFAGVDPNIIFDAVWMQWVPDSDVLLFYLSTDRTRLMCRVQRELYSVAREIHEYSAPVVFDRVVRAPLRYEAFASDAAGDPLLVGGDGVAVISDLYPAREGHTLLGGGGPEAVMGYRAEVYRYPGGDGLTGHGSPLSMVYATVVLVWQEGPESLAGDGDTVSPMEYRSMIFTIEEGPEGVTGDGGVEEDMAYRLMVFRESGTEEMGGDGGVEPTMRYQAV